MIKVMFVCHGNICRSPMCEFILKDMVSKLGLENEFEISSSATSREEIGNDMYSPAKQKLREEGIPFTKRAARQFTYEDYEYYDYVIIMERYNFVNLCRIIRDDTDGKVNLLLGFTGANKDIADPWYTGDFDRTYREIVAGCKAFLKQLNLPNTKF